MILIIRFCINYLMMENLAIACCLPVTIWKDGDPCKVGIPATDIATGLYASTSIIAALFEKQKSGLGQKIDCNLLNTQVSDRFASCYHTEELGFYRRCNYTSSTCSKNFY